MNTSRDDPVYEAGVEVAPVWESVENADDNKKMYLEGSPSLSKSPVTKYLKDRTPIFDILEVVDNEPYLLT